MTEKVVSAPTGVEVRHEVLREELQRDTGSLIGPS